MKADRAPDMGSRLELFGHAYQYANKEHVCWCCGETIRKGVGYFKTTGKFAERMFSVKHCRTKCECVAELLDQNPDIARAVFSRTLVEGMLKSAN